MGRRKRNSKFVSSYFDQQYQERDKKFTNSYNYYSYSGAGTAEIRKVAEKVFGNPYGFKVKKHD
jgi:hypothetical protein